MRKVLLILACSAYLGRTGRLRTEPPQSNWYPAPGEESSLSVPVPLPGLPLLPAGWLDFMTFDMQEPAESPQLTPPGTYAGDVPDPLTWACVAAGLGLLLASASPRRRVGREKRVSSDNIPRVPAQ